VNLNRQTANEKEVVPINRDDLFFVCGLPVEIHGDYAACIQTINGELARHPA